MKKQIKKCKGFNETVCRICKRQDNNSDRLVSELAIKGENKVCQYFLK
jgi:hypothetical protein